MPVYGVPKVLEDRGQVRRGYFVSGLAPPSRPPRSCRQAAIDTPPRRSGIPAIPMTPVSGHRRRWSCRRPTRREPYGGTLPWPESPGRPAHRRRLVVLRHGVPLVWHDRRSHHLGRLLAPVSTAQWADALAALVHDGRMRSVEIRKVNGPSVAESPDGGWVARSPTPPGPPTAIAAGPAPDRPLTGTMSA